MEQKKDGCRQRRDIGVDGGKGAVEAAVERRHRAKIPAVSSRMRSLMNIRI